MRILKRLRLYPMVVLLCWVVPTAFRAHQSLHPDSHTYTLGATAAFLAPLQGLLDVFVYGLTKNVRYELKAKMCPSLLQSQYNKESDENDDDDDDDESEDDPADNGGAQLTNTVVSDYGSISAPSGW